MSVVRRRNVPIEDDVEPKSDFYNKIKKLDAFTKVNPANNYQEKKTIFLDN